VQRFRGGLEFKAHIICVSLNSRLESDKEEEKVLRRRQRPSPPAKVQLFFSSSLLLSSLELSDEKVYEPEIRALLGTAKVQLCLNTIHQSNETGSQFPRIQCKSVNC